jgi:NAD(P)-dependent dehydrogenase (short-subunit alcohol dehydrogenase family)
MGRLQGKVAVITGAASGIGRGTAELFVAEGAKVVGGDIQDDKGARMEEELGENFAYARCDVADESQIKAAIDRAVSRWGRIDALFNNAGTGGALETAETVTAEGFDSVMHLHIRAALFGMKHAVPHMKAQGGGSIVSTASIAGLQNGFGPILYSIAKAGIVHMSKVAAAQLGPFNIRVNAVCPGLIATAIFARSVGMATQVADQTVGAIAEAAKTAQPIPRGGLPRDIAEAVLYLCSDGASFVTGQALAVDGGITVGPTGEAQTQVFAPLMQAMGIDPAILEALRTGAASP